MSAASGISAAKRRRGVGSEMSTSQTTNSKQTTQQPQLITPIQILQNHEIRLKNIEKHLSDAEEYANNMVDNETNNKVVAPLPVQMNLNETNVLMLNEYKNRCETLEKKVEELTQLLQKVQTFSMETNLSFFEI